MKEFTKGPWEVELTINKIDYDDQCWVLGGKGAICLIPIKHENRDANADLIAAAPEMYEMLEDLSSKLTDINAHNTVNDIEKLLAKARGEK